MNRKELTFSDIKDFVNRQIFCRGSLVLTPDTRLGEDLLVIGDDADEFLDAFSKKFDVDISRMNFSDYFPCEATADMHYYLTDIAAKKPTNKAMGFIRKLESCFWKVLSKKDSYRTITLEELLFVAKQGIWD